LKLFYQKCKQICNKTLQNIRTLLIYSSWSDRRVWNTWEAQSNGEVLLHLLFPIFLNLGMTESRVHHSHWQVIFLLRFNFMETWKIWV